MKRKLTISIDINWGSEWQQDFFEQMLQVLLKTWKDYALTKHRENKITYEIDNNDGYKIKQF